MRKTITICVLAIFVCALMAARSDAQDNATSTIAMDMPLVLDVPLEIQPATTTIDILAAASENTSTATNDILLSPVVGTNSTSTTETASTTVDFSPTTGQSVGAASAGEATSILETISVPADTHAETLTADSLVDLAQDIFKEISQQIENFAGEITAASEDPDAMQLLNATSTVALLNELVDGVSDAMEVAEIAANATSTEPSIIEEPARVLAQWQMTQDGLDDSADIFAQIMPSGKFETNANFKICGIVAIGSGANQADSVEGQIFYPKNVSFGSNDANGRLGCGQAVAPAVKMEKLTPADGFELFCKKIQKNNVGLPKFAQDSSYIDFCAENGELMSEDAAVYCANTKLAYDDLSGGYSAQVSAKNNSGDDSDKMEGNFTYLPLTAFEMDFSNINYGSVKENSEAIASGDTLFDAQQITRATVRNVGNTRLNVSVWQDDMGLGKTNGSYNIWYRSRLGIDDASWVTYQPFETAALAEVLDLSSIAPMDFGTVVSNYPATTTIDYRGEMKIDALAIDNYECEAANEH